MDRDAAFDELVLEQWRLAVEHAGFEISETRLWFGRGPHDPAAGADYYLPVREIEGAHGLSNEQFAEAHTDETRALHRVVVYPDYNPDGDQAVADDLLAPVFGALLRHELEHARQFASCGYDLFDLDGSVVMPVLSHQAGGLPGSMALYNLKPIEQDANSAAALFLREHHPTAVDRILTGPCSQLARSLVGPGDPRTLSVRSVCFLFLLKEACERAVEGSFAVSTWIGTYDASLGKLWSALEAETDQTP